MYVVNNDYFVVMQFLFSHYINLKILSKQYKDMEEYYRWNLNIPRALYNDLKHMSIDEGKSINHFCQPAIDIFISELVALRDQTLAVRAKQREEAEIVASHPLEVSGIGQES